MRLISQITTFLFLSTSIATAADWPAQHHDERRSCATEETIPTKNLGRTWTKTSQVWPIPAWPGPARWDAYKNTKFLSSMRNYDPVFHVSVAGDTLFYGSSLSDGVHALDTKTGKERWCYITDGPVRVAPTYYKERVYFGSDDGYAYCLNAKNGKLVWKTTPFDKQSLVLHNGRLISFFPCRTGVAIKNGTAYFGNSLFPWKPSWLCAVDAQTGQVTGTAHYMKKIAQASLEGPIIVADNFIIQSMGRVPPQLFSRKKGTSAGHLNGKGNGGCFVLVTEDEHIFHGPGNKKGWLTESGMQNRDKIATFGEGRALVVVKDTAWLLTNNSISAIDRKNKAQKWKQNTDCSHAMIYAGGVLFLGGEDRVKAIDAKTGKELWSAVVKGRAFGLAAASGALFVSTDEGEIACFRPGGKKPAPKLPKRGSAKSAGDGEYRPMVGPSFSFTDAQTAVVTWQTYKAAPSIIQYGYDKNMTRIGSNRRTKKHSVTLKNIRKNRVYRIEVIVKGKGVTLMEMDTHANFMPQPIPKVRSVFKNRAIATEAKKIISKSGVNRGLCVMGECGNGELAWNLVKNTNLKVICFSNNKSDMEKARASLRKAGVYGSRVTIIPDPNLSGASLPNKFADLIITSAKGVKSDSDIDALLQPGGIKWADGRHKGRSLTSQTGVWTHQYGMPDNTAFGGESLGGARSTKDLEVVWFGYPGPRHQSDRNGRKPSPLAISGRLFCYGYHRITAVSSYNGSILWARDLLDFHRYNIPRDSGPWCADKDALYVTNRDGCLKIDAASGDIITRFRVPKLSTGNKARDWGYIARHKELLIGSSRKPGVTKQNFWGGSGAGWYDARGGQAIEQIYSRQIFAISPKTGAKRWLRETNCAIDSTITIRGNNLYFVESRNKDAINSGKGILPMNTLGKNMYLVCLATSTGKRKWEQKLDIKIGIVAFYLTATDKSLVIVSSQNKKYFVYSFSAKNGKVLWGNSLDWKVEHHGGQLSRPAIVDDKLFVRPCLFDLNTGQKLVPATPYGGCGTYASTTNMFIYRSGNITLWDVSKKNAKDATSSWHRLRPGCWLSTIPADGMLLAPEGGGGCSCGMWMETSVGFAPIKRH